MCEYTYTHKPAVYEIIFVTVFHSASALKYRNALYSKKNVESMSLVKRRLDSWKQKDVLKIAQMLVAKSIKIYIFFKFSITLEEQSLTLSIWLT